jgi:tRNA (adenine58-N1)-methyltransferase non-catalytic subunit
MAGEKLKDTKVQESVDVVMDIETTVKAVQVVSSKSVEVKSASTERNPDKIYIDDNVLLMMPSGNSKLIKIKNDKISLGKFGNFHMNDLVGCYFERSYEITRDGIKPATTLQLDVTLNESNNQFITDDHNAGQKLTREEIEGMKKDSLAGNANHQDIIQKLVDNNSTFEQKTNFSKQKYIARKEKKFSKVFTPLKPTARVLCDYWFEKNPEKTMQLRLDTFSQMLSMSNVKSGSRILCVDEIGGLLALGYLHLTQSS